MFLCYKPSGRIVELGRRMGFGWDSFKNMDLDEFFRKCEDDCLDNDGSHQDDFCLLMEDADGMTDCFGSEWHYEYKKEDDGSITCWAKFK